MWSLHPPGIARRSSVLRWGCGIEEARVILASKDSNELVRKVRQDAVKVMERKERGEAPWARREVSYSSSGSGRWQGRVRAAWWRGVAMVVDKRKRGLGV